MKEYVIHSCELIPYEGYSIVEVFRSTYLIEALSKLETLSAHEPGSIDTKEMVYVLEIENLPKQAGA